MRCVRIDHTWFESYVILDTTKTMKLSDKTGNEFESYVILDTTKTVKVI